MSTTSNIKVLSSGEVSNMQGKCLEFLSTKGVILDHQETLKILKKAGAQVDFETQNVKFSRDIIESALKSVPHELTLASHDGRHDCILPHPDGLFYTRNGTGCAHWVEPGTNKYTDVTLAKVAEWGQLTEVLENIDLTAFLTPMDVPGETGDIHSLKTILENTTKHVQCQPWSLGSVKYLLELASVVVGSKEELKKRPIVDLFCVCTTPYLYKDMDGEILLESCRYELPILAQSLPCSAGTAPVTIAGTVLIAVIEVLAILVMAQMIKPGLPVIGCSSLYTIDMATGRTVPGNIESVLASAAFAQFVKEGLKIPAYTLGYMPNAYIPDGEAMIQATMRGMLVALSGCDILMNAGRINAGLAASPVELIQENTIADIVKRALQGVPVDEDTLGWDDIKNTQPGGHFLETAHTLKHCRDAIQVKLFSNQTYEAWVEEGKKDLMSRATDEYHEIKKQLKPLDMTDEVKRELNRIVKHADEHMIK